MRFAFFSLALALVPAVGCYAMTDRGDPSTGTPVIRVPLLLSSEDPGPTSKSVPYSPDLHLFLSAVVDQRDDPMIGANTEGAPPIPVNWAGTDPATFVGWVVGRSLHDLGYQLTTNADTANRFLQLRLVRFYVVEGALYRAEVRATAEVRDRAGRIVFASTVTGNAKQWGRSRSPDNYREVLTRASFDMVKSMMDTPAFQAAFQVHEPPVAAH